MANTQSDNLTPPMPGACTPAVGNTQPCDTSFDQLPDEARLLVIPCRPALNEQQQNEAVTAIDKLFAIFAAEGRISMHGSTVAADGAFLLIGWIDQVHPLSGCSHDKVNRLLGTIAERSGSALLGHPPIILETADGLAFMDRPGFRKQVEAGMVSAESEAWDHLANTVGAWRSGARRPISEHWLAPVLARITG